ncbi:MAG TPA: DNA repair protein RecN [Actinomycetota bacterium]|jgi:DNA repair protein RecN (Recombination protein N)
MLEELHVAGLGVIRDASLDFSPGLNVLTGETGAGKTLVTVALALAIGARGTSELARADGPGPAVEARFAPPDAGGDLGEWTEDGTLVLARSLRPDARGSARAGGRLVPVSTLASLGSKLVEIHGQHQVERLLNPSAQTEFLDRFAGPEHLRLLAEYRVAHEQLLHVRGRLEALDGRTREREREKDLLGYQVAEIEAAGLEPNEPQVLAAESSRLANAERLQGLADGASFALGGDEAAVDRLRQAAQALEAAAALDPSAADASARAAALVAEADDLAGIVRAYRDGVDADPARLAAVEERLHLIRDLERKYGDGVEAIVAFGREARDRLAGLEGDEGERMGLREEVERLAARQDALASRVGKDRAAAAPDLAEAVTAELRELGLPGGRIDVTLESLGLSGPDGGERAVFVFAAGPGQPPRPLAKVASGGELSRTMLACRSVLADLDDIPTLVFDEVDAGIGGRAAVAVGRRLAALARTRQVVVVTHLAQIASRADRHFVVTKSEGAAAVRALDAGERPEELARMLSGSVNDVSLAHARELLSSATDRTGDSADEPAAGPAQAAVARGRTAKRRGRPA